MTPLKAGAIALTLIIAVPIILGYGLASEASDVDVDVTENTGSLSDIILNSTTPYYVTYSGANNNGTMLQTVVAQGGTSSTMVNPTYIETSATTYTYTPIYATSTSSVEMDAATTTTYSDNSGDYYGIGITVDVELPTFASAAITNVFGMAYGVSYNLEYEVDSEADYVTIGVSTAFYATPNGDGYLISGTDYNGDDFAIDCDGFKLPVIGDLTVIYNDYYTIPSSFPDVWSTNVSGMLALSLTSGSDTTVVSYTDATSIVVSYGTVTVTHSTENDIFTDVTAIGYAQTPGSTTLTYYYQSSTISTYADVTYGWTLPDSSSPYYDFWMNGFVNSYIRMMVHLEAGEYLVITENMSDTKPALELESSSAGFVTVEIEDTEYSLGAYTDMMVEIQAGVNNQYATVTVTGIAAWPAIGSIPDTTYNSVSGDCTLSLTDDFTQLYMADNDTNSVEIRVDSTEIIAGYFPSTEDYTLDLTSLYPGVTRQSVVIDSVGIYGEGITLGAESFTITDGTITVNGESVSIKGMIVDFDYDGSVYTVSVDGYELSTTSSAAKIVFEGEWSLTLHRTETTTETVTQTQWVAGEFALDENGFVMAMLLVALAAFVGLGMTGGRSGTKVGILAMICGGAVIVGLLII